MFHWSLLYLISEWIVRLVMLVYVPQRRSSAATRTWLLLIFLLPWPGIILYALFGRIHMPGSRIEEQIRASRHIRAVQEQMGKNFAANPALCPHFEPASILAQQLGDFEPFGGNAVELLSNYVRSIDRLIADIDSASHHVHLLYYIFLPDSTGRRVADALVRAAKRDVDCRVLMDAVGSKLGLAKLAPSMRANGIEVHAMLPVGLFRRNAARFDLRNHRKIAVIDGTIGYTGSQNLSDPASVPGYPNEELVVRVTGPAVAQLQAVFLADQYFETGTMLPEQEMFPAIPGIGSSPAQVVPSGPGYKHQNGQELIIALLYAARKQVVITTPYFVPDEPFLLAIRSAALRGVVVHLVVSRHANQLVTQLAQRACYDALLEAGVQIHLYRPHFLHAKHLSFDDGIALIGSTNIDIRSFALNSEINILVYDPKVVADLRTIQTKYFENSDLLTCEEWNKRPLLAKVAQNTARLADSLL
ncbi:MAG: cardiolipin synthase [Chthoniobacteraceae bacterium]